MCTLEILKIFRYKIIKMVREQWIIFYDNNKHGVHNAMNFICPYYFNDIWYWMMLQWIGFVNKGIWGKESKKDRREDENDGANEELTWKSIIATQWA